MKAALLYIMSNDVIVPWLKVFEFSTKNIFRHDLWNVFYFESEVFMSSVTKKFLRGTFFTWCVMYILEEILKEYLGSIFALE